METGNEKVLRSEPPCLIRFQLQKGLFIEKIQFLLERCLVSVLGVRTLFIVENHIPVYCRSEFIFGTVFCSVELLTLQIGEESLHDGIVIRDMRS